MHNRLKSKKLVLATFFAALAFVLNTVVVFPAMAPFQHFVNAIATYLLGPWYAFCAALLTGGMRMLVQGRTIMAVTGGIVGPLLAGYLYQKTKSLWLLALGEALGSGVFGALLSYPFMVNFYGMKAGHWWALVPFFLPSAAVGAGMALFVLLTSKKTGLFDRLKSKIEE